MLMPSFIIRQSKKWPKFSKDMDLHGRIQKRDYSIFLILIDGETVYLNRFIYLLIFNLTLMCINQTLVRYTFKTYMEQKVGALLE